MKALPRSYYQQNDVVGLAKDLIGKKLVTSFNDQITSGIITETEAYRSWGDKACHAYLNKRTKRTEIMFQAGGLAYVYLCYGIHHLFNIVSDREGQASAVLVRAVEPLDGLEIMLQRRNKTKGSPDLTAGPGRLSQALGIRTEHYGSDLTGNEIWLEEGSQVPDKYIAVSTRIGVDYADKDALLPWRFYLKPSRFVSKR